LGKEKQGNPRGENDNRTAEDKRVDEDKWLHRENYDELVALGTLQAHRGNTSGEIRSNYWPDKGTKHTQDDFDKQGKDDTQGRDDTYSSNPADDVLLTDTFVNDVEALRMLWIKEDTSWNTAEVFGEHRKKLRAFSEDYKYRKIKLLGHVIRAINDDPMRKVTLRQTQ